MHWTHISDNKKLNFIFFEFSFTCFFFLQFFGFIPRIKFRRHIRKIRRRIRSECKAFDKNRIVICFFGWEKRYDEIEGADSNSFKWNLI